MISIFVGVALTPMHDKDHPSSVVCFRLVAIDIEGSSIDVQLG